MTTDGMIIGLRLHAQKCYSTYGKLIVLHQQQLHNNLDVTVYIVAEKNYIGNVTEWSNYNLLLLCV